jgi:hypothetical protein
MGQFAESGTVTAPFLLSCWISAPRSANIPWLTGGTNMDPLALSAEKHDISVLEMLFERVDLPEVEGRYCPSTQTWEHRDWLQFTPVKHNQEM